MKKNMVLLENEEDIVQALAEENDSLNLRLYIMGDRISLDGINREKYCLSRGINRARLLVLALEKAGISFYEEF